MLQPLQAISTQPTHALSWVCPWISSFITHPLHTPADLYLRGAQRGDADHLCRSFCVLLYPGHCTRLQSCCYSVTKFFLSLSSKFFAAPWTIASQASCLWPVPGVCSNSCPLDWWCHPTISSTVAPFFCLQSFLASGKLALSIRWPKCWSISPSSKYSGLIYFL